ncbi:glutamate-1-semialdehyde 2,1-aminomutase [Campylobacter ureolyticus]|uniref:Glutamate-1-semialdehyde 2,1-aminomutase n=1 Tax=Campylobacter ureolyticus TaxID=827 RepID=A0A9Q4KRI1_9BACT|nr:glutamate-1-semialdehyde 2,1-aminomutase [Campylobacter ureolyticus]MCZ6102976.1 glutamate-1-semialdehyde 2,1-aminomutase [Campylobacter ureolyticus]MCZ6134264.1 glutamate-1-semialdehyde 2,1-aminomutase [Campylobacter ureolyticus]MCZ6161308.1 glutamate-1-semialdehyde 2,1-aminomutase [Campylobacter ureolyticus]MCZ6170408.1 glutamate-1-semialdehyde 2,1-aminomutase [Campylobacter ureolyticus]
MTNLQAFKEAKKVIPGGVDSPVRAFGNVGSHPFFVKSAKGAYIEDIEGKKYLDFVQSWGPLIFGHCDETIEKAVIQTAKNGLSFGASSPLETKLANLILKDFPHLDMIRFVSSGTEATMSAIRLARGYSKKDGIIKFEGNYHGHSDSLLVKAGSGAATFGATSSAGVPKSVAENTFVAIYNDIESVKEILSKNDNIGTIIIEPIAGNMGLVPSKPEFLKALRKICDEKNIVLILDEVMSGYRASKTGSFGIYGVKADIVTFGKVIGGGMNAAAFAAKKEIMSLISPLGDVYQAGTLSGNPVAMAAGIASLTKISNTLNLYEKLEKLAIKFTDGLKKIAKENGINIQTCVRGSMFGYFFTDKKVENYADALTSDLNLFAKFHTGMINEGVFLAPSQFETGFICDAMSEEDIDFALNAAKKVMANLKK